METDCEPSTSMSDVREGHLVVWNGRTNPQVVTDVTDSWFEVRSHRGSRYRFYPHGGHLINRQSDAEYDIEEFAIVGKAYDVSLW